MTRRVILESPYAGDIKLGGENIEIIRIVPRSP